MSNIKLFFHDNERLGETIEQIVNQKITMKKVRSWAVSDIIFRGFTITMDIPAQRIFIDLSENINNLAYVHRITYGVTGYFVITSNLTYQEVLTHLTKSSISSTDSYEALSQSQIILLTMYNTSQNTILQTSFEKLEEFYKNPFYSDSYYGYPIYYMGVYAKNNSYFQIEDDKIVYKPH